MATIQITEVILKKNNYFNSFVENSNFQETPSRMESFKGKLKHFINKYFREGQKLTSDQVEALANLDPNAPWQEKVMIKHRKLIGFLIPFCFFQLCWWCLAFKHDFFSLFPDRYILSLTMVLGATVAGMTSEGGGAVAFPVMTLALKISPAVARDFSLMIQSCG